MKKNILSLFLFLSFISNLFSASASLNASFENQSDKNQSEPNIIYFGPRQPKGLKKIDSFEVTHIETNGTKQYLRSKITCLNNLLNATFYIDKDIYEISNESLIKINKDFKDFHEISGLIIQGIIIHKKDANHSLLIMCEDGIVIHTTLSLASTS